MARTLLTPEVQDRILVLIRKGHFSSTAANAAGVAAATVNEWLKRGRQPNPDEPFGAFAVAYAQAEAEAEAKTIALIDDAAKDQWQAAAWKAARRWPERWANKDRTQVELSGQNGGAIHVSLDDIAQAMGAITQNAVEKDDGGDRDNEPEPGPGSD